MFDSLVFNLAIGLLGAVLMLLWRQRYPKPLPGIPYNAASAWRIAGDVTDLLPLIKATNEFSESVFTITTQKLGTPVAQLLLPGFRKPLVILEDPREAEDIVVRRNKDFDKAAMSIDLFKPMFPRATFSQTTTPELKAQKRLWADIMSTEFLRKVAAPNINKSAIELVDLWRLKASTVHKDEPFSVDDDFKNAALDAIWLVMVGQEPGMSRFELRKLQNQINWNKLLDEAPPRGVFLKREVEYLFETIHKNANSPMPKWSQKLETLTPRYRKFRRTVSNEIGRAMHDAVARFQRLELGKLEDDDADTCAMDLVLRRQMLEARKAGRPPSDPTQDQSMLDEMFVLFVGVSTQTAHTFKIRSRATTE